MSASTDLLISLAPEMAGVSTATLDQFILIATGVHTASAWSVGTYATAMAYYAAHLLTMADAAAASPSAASAASATAGGPVSSKREGSRAIAYASPVSSAGTAEEAQLMETKYGRLYLALRKRQVVMRVVPAVP